jgi:uncharacterized protein YbjT (DUF2867 family)
MNIIITGVTGMVGEGVLHEAILSPIVHQILVIGRRPCGINHEKVSELILPEFLNPGPALDSVSGYDACLFCLGVSSVGMKKEDYEKYTYDLTLGFARTILPGNPNLVFLYVSGAGTDSTEKSRMHWARVKGKTENDLQRIGFRAAYGIRPGYMHPTPGLKNVPSWAKYVTWMYRPLRTLFPNRLMTLGEMGRGMIMVAREGFPRPILEAQDIIAMARKHP